MSAKTLSAVPTWVFDLVAEHVDRAEGPASEALQRLYVELRERDDAGRPQIIGWSAVRAEPSPCAHALKIVERGGLKVAVPICGADAATFGAVEPEPPSYCGGPCRRCLRIVAPRGRRSVRDPERARTGVLLIQSRGNSIHSIRAADVRPGDELWTGRPAPYAWTRVLGVRTHLRSVVIETGGWSTWKHPDEGVTIRRLVELPITSCASDCEDSEPWRSRSQ